MQKEEGSPDRLPSRRKNSTLPLVSNIVLVGATAAILWWSAGYFRQSIAFQTAQESRFLTMEWNLLQELKAQTDQQLMEKDREIATLRNQYNQLLAQGGTEADLSALEDRLASAEAERETIVRERIEIAQPPTTDAVTRRIDEQSSVLTGKLQAELDELRREMSDLSMDYRELDERIDDAERRISDTLNALEGLATTSSFGFPEPATSDTATSRSEQSTMQMINTRARVRAVLSSPDIRRDYPELMDNLDNYMTTLESRARANGVEATLAETSAEIESLADKLNVALPLSTFAPAETWDGFFGRLQALVSGVVRIGEV